MAELAWTTARLFCLSQMEEELLEELDKERCLSQLFSRKVTLEGLQMLVSIVHPKAAKLLTNSAFPYLSRLGSVSETLLLCVCTKDAQSMVEAIYNRFDKCSRSFKLMDYDESYYNSREGVISAIQDMDHEVQTDAPSQAHFQLEEGLVEEREASPWVALDQEVDFMSKDVTEDTYRKEATLVQDSVVQNMDNDEQTAASSQAHLHMKEELLEKRETSLDLSPLEELEEGLVDKREASPRVALEEEVDTFPNDVTEDTYGKEETLVQDTAIEDMDHEVQFGASSEPRIKLEEGLIAEREASLYFTSLEELENGLVEQIVASTRVALDEEVDTLPHDVKNMNHVEQLDASSQAPLQLEEGLLEERETSPQVSLDGEVDSVSNDVTEETLVQDSAIQDMDRELYFGASRQAHLQLDEGLLEEREACFEITSSEELDMGITEVSKVSAQVSLDEEVDTLPKDVIDDTYRKKETLVQVSVHYMDHKVQFHASSQADIQLEEGPLERRKASPRVSLEEMATRVSLANRDTSSVKLESNGAVYMVDELEILQQEEVETHDFLVQDCADKKKKKKKKKGLRAFFCGLRKMMTCGFCVPIKQ
ncbi:uncharacterized protein LOC116694130 isoform X2 [Etheostoma spectabile]|nr:uncharacterized protein LOC116694130 isoform X2 [Etheostoma spectabile]